MKKYKLVATDLDFTLVYDRDKINEENLIYLKKYLSQGYPFVIITGRPLFTCLPLMAKLGLDKYSSLALICYNGMVYYSFKDKKAIDIATKIDFQEIVKLHDFTYSKGLNLLMYYDEKVFAQEVFDFQDKKESIDHLPLIIDKNITKENKKPLYKAIIAYDREKTEKYVVDLEKLFPNLDFYFSQRFYLEVMPKNINKGSAVEYILKKYNLSKDEIIVLGDSENDVFMFKKVSTSFAMANASKEIKNQASEVLKDVKEANFKFLFQKYFSID